MIECELITGGTKQVPVDQMIFRPAAYAIIANDSQILFVNTKSTGKWFFPGGAVEKGETVEDALRREVFEETGMMLHHVSLFTFKESFFHYEPHDKAYHCFNLFFTAAVQRGAYAFPRISRNIDSSDEANRCQWVDLKSIRPKDMQSFGWEIMQRFFDLRKP